MATVRENAVRILNAVYEDTQGNQWRRVHIEKFMKPFNLTEEETKAAASYLFGKGLLSGNTIIANIPWGCITSSGIDAIEEARGHPNRETRHLPAIQNIINVGTMHGGGIQQGTTSSTQTVNISYSIADLSKLADELSTLRSALAADASTVDHYAAIGAVANAEKSAKEGKAEGVGTALRTIGKDMMGWVGKIGEKVGTEFAIGEIQKLINGAGS